MTRERNDAQKECLVCGAKGVRLTRGLCSAHHSQYRRSRQEAEDPEAFDQHLIRCGLLLPSQQGKKLAPGENVFENALRELEGRQLPELDMHKAKKAARKPADEAAADLVDEATEVQQEAEKKAGQGAGRKKRGRKS